MAGEFPIEISGLTYRFDVSGSQEPVINGIDLTLQAGEIIVMTGPSGSGKTTLLTLIGALRAMQQGSLKVLGRELANLPAEELITVRRDIGFIFQSHNLLQSLTARQNVKLALEITERDRSDAFDKTDAVLERLGLGERLHYKPEDLSGGQRQRVAVARALVTEPRIILADEPTAALDEKTSRKVVELLRERADKQGATVLIVTHDDRILDVADRIVNMLDGRIASNILVEETVQVCEFLRKCDVFTGLTLQDLMRMAQQMTFETFPSGSRLFSAGDVGDRFYLIRDGEVSVEPQDQSGTAIRLGQGQFFGEAALLTGEPRNATVSTTSDSAFYTLDKQEFLRVLEESAPFAQQVRSSIFQRR